MYIDQYFLNLKNPKHHDDLQQLRGFIQQAMPTLTESMMYGMPTYLLNGQCERIEYFLDLKHGS